MTSVKRFSVHLGGRDRELKYSLPALMKVEKELAINTIAGNLFDNLNLTKIVVLTWAALLHWNKTLTIEQVADWLPADDVEHAGFYADLIGQLVQAYFAYKGLDPEEIEKKMAEEAQALKELRETKSEQTGSNSTPSTESSSG